MPVFVALRARGAPKLDRRVLRRRAERMLAHLGIEDAELSILLTDDTVIESLNRKHRGKAKPTDVLAFQMDAGPEPAGGPRLLGDVVVSLDTAARQARARRRALAAEVTHLLAHGLLHLVGYDHRTDAEERTMNALVARLVRAATSAKPAARPLSKELRDRV